MVSTCTEYCSVFDCCLQGETVCGLREVTADREQSVNNEPASDGGLESGAEDDDGQRNGSLVRDVPDRMVCSACRCCFNSREEQMEHYKLDWHRFNLKQKLGGRQPVTVEEFERKTGTGDVSSLSGSESDSGGSDSDGDWDGKRRGLTHTDNGGSVEGGLIPSRRSSKVVFKNSEGQYLAVYRCVLQGKSDGEDDLVASLKTISNKTVWVILMTGGGHFAGAVYQGKEVLQHKTFHRYTVRAKRGTAQGLRDAQNRSHAPKSAGAALRRHNEAALAKEVQDLLDSWADHLKMASAIFLRAPSYNKTIFLGGRAALDKKDPRIRTLPFATRRATFREVQRVHSLLSTVHVYEKDTAIATILSPSKKVLRKAPKPTAQPSPEQESAEADEHDDSGKEEDGETLLEIVEVTLGTLDLREYEIQPSRHKRRRRRKKDGNKMEREEVNTMERNKPDEAVLEATPTEDSLADKPTKTKPTRMALSKKMKHLEEEVDESWEYGLRDALYTACKIGDVASLCRLLQLPQEADLREGPEEQGSNTSLKQQPSPDGISPLTHLNKPIDSSGFTLLHVASAAGQGAVVKLLMDAGADPSYRDNKGQTPYIVAPEKDTRNVFRKYMGENPDKYDYSKAQVPGPLTAETESRKMEKKRAQKAAKRQREKEQKEEKRKQELEAEERKRFASLTDREKRALAAERRLAEKVAMTDISLSNIQRCWLCGDSLLGKIPFHYLDYSFCSPRCVQAHRKASAPTART
ncbi:ankyrin repeat and zinc finger domain-containing protein 1 isoform X2 [Lampris incognitus]|uniref:ankyrin repeat and zinc finger domain-containing protein 1 isoform X2 n=1 Tax=Lampris incognitus TaxID=2546036 RepID=UPI0024B54399|nr:ankyrin repeat and zinc finger domain-containing protein 1 isoform X2 [Lampris incognitus]